MTHNAKPIATFGLLIVFLTFIFKEILRDEAKDSRDSLNAARTLFQIQSGIDGLHKILDQLVIEREYNVDQFRQGTRNEGQLLTILGRQRTIVSGQSKNERRLEQAVRDLAVKEKYKTAFEDATRKPDERLQGIEKALHQGDSRMRNELNRKSSEHVKWRIGILVACIPLVIPGQVVQTGSPDADFCAKAEVIRPNLVLKLEAHVFGAVQDQAGAPLANSPIEIRRYISEQRQDSMQTTKTDVDGKFDLGVLRAGAYRILPASTRAFKQPDLVNCEQKECSLAITLRVNRTDLPISLCPIR